jgi:catalase
MTAQAKTALVDPLTRDLIQAFDTINGGVHPGYRPAHAKGIFLSGTFTPSPKAATLTRAPHASRPSTPVAVRFSDFAGIPSVADNDVEHAGPRGFALRFYLAEHTHTDIIGHTVDLFPTRTGEEFLEFLRAAAASGPGASKPLPIEKFLGSHPAALAFVQTPKPIPTSFAKDTYYAVNAYRFSNAQGTSVYGRYRILPEGGNEYLDAAAAAKKGPNFLFEEMRERIARGPVRMHIQVQTAASGDVTDDATVQWPASRPLVDFGTIELNTVVPEGDAAQRHIIFDPIPRVDGIEPSADPLLDVRANLYLVSGRRRRAAGA